MKRFFPVLQTCPLFEGIKAPDLQSLLSCLSAARKHFEKNSFVFLEDEKAELVGIVLSGAVHVVHEDFWGDRVIVSRVEGGELFGEAFSCAGIEKLPVSVLAAEESEILLIDCKRILSSCTSACVFHTGLIKNLARILARQNVRLTQKLEHITRRSTREKLLSYLSEQALRFGGNEFDIPFNRQELADYLSVERSAMSAELSKMRDENLLDYDRSHFKLLG